MKRSLYAISFVLAACGGEAAQPAREPATAAPVGEAGPEPEAYGDTTVTVEQADTAVAVEQSSVSHSESTPAVGAASESYESCMARVNQGGDRGANSASCSHVADTPR